MRYMVEQPAAGETSEQAHSTERRGKIMNSLTLMLSVVVQAESHLQTITLQRKISNPSDLERPRAKSGLTPYSDQHDATLCCPDPGYPECRIHIPCIKVLSCLEENLFRKEQSKFLRTRPSLCQCKFRAAATHRIPRRQTCLTTNHSFVINYIAAPHLQLQSFRPGTELNLCAINQKRSCIAVDRHGCSMNGFWAIAGR